MASKTLTLISGGRGPLRVRFFPGCTRCELLEGIRDALNAPAGARLCLRDEEGVIVLVSPSMPAMTLHVMVEAGDEEMEKEDGGEEEEDGEEEEEEEEEDDAGGRVVEDPRRAAALVGLDENSDIQIVFRLGDTTKTYKAKRGTPFWKFFDHIAKGAESGPYRFFNDNNGELVDPDATPHSLNMISGDTVSAYSNQTGSIGVFVRAGEEDWLGVPVLLAPGAALLTAPRGGAAAPPPRAAAIAALARAVLAPARRPPRGDVLVGGAAALPAAAHAALAAAADAAWAAGAQWGTEPAFAREPRGAPAAAVASAVSAGSTRDDFKLLLSGATAAAVLGARGVAAVLGALEAVRRARPGAPPLALRSVVFALRRTQARGMWIGFHYDTAGATAQLPLAASGGAGCVGGRTLFALPCGRLLAPERVAGRVVAHHGDVAHGVTRHEAGTRYGLFALVAREDAEGL
jgi:hypothetical protein